MTQITPGPQKPTPNPDRPVAPYAADASTPHRPESAQHRGFRAVLRDLSRSRSAGSADADVADDRTATAKTRAERAGDAASGTAPTGSAVAMLADILSATLPVTAVGTMAGGSTAGGSTAGGSTAGGSTAGSGAALAPGSTTGDGRDRTSDPLSDGLDPAAAPKVEVLDRAVHFQPVLTGSAHPGAAASKMAASLATPAEGGTGNPRSRPSGLADPAATPSPATASAEGGAGTPQPIRNGSPGLVTAAAKVLPQPRIESASGSDDGAPPAAAAEANRPGAGTSEDIRAISGLTRTVLTSTGAPEQGGKSGTAHRDPAGSPLTLPAAALPALAAAIREELERAAAGSGGGVHGEPAVGHTPDGPLRVLRIQLRPEDLGIVTVELRLTDGQLETHLRASRPETAALLQRDAAVLTDLLQRSNHRAEVTVEPARPADAGGAFGGSPSQGQPASTDGGARPGQGGDRQRQPAQRQMAGREGERMDETVRPRDGSVYL